jgi:L-fucose mutarotase
MNGPTMLKYSLIHPPLLAALAVAGHGSKILLADANFACGTNTFAGAERIYLNLRPGLLTVDQVLECVVDASPIEAATMMRPEDGSTPAARTGYAQLLGDAIDIGDLDRSAFYAACRGPELAAVVATGDQRHFANILLTVGFNPPS